MWTINPLRPPLAIVYYLTSSKWLQPLEMLNGGVFFKVKNGFDFR